MPIALIRVAKLLKAAAAIGTAYGIVRAVRRSRSVEVTGTASWPPLGDDSDPKPKPAAAGVEPLDGACPPAYPIKAKKSSKIFHAPGGRFYERTSPEVCFASEADAQAAGYRRSRS